MGEIEKEAEEKMELVDEEVEGKGDGNQVVVGEDGNKDGSGDAGGAGDVEMKEKEVGDADGDPEPEYVNFGAVEPDK